MQQIVQHPQEKTAQLAWTAFILMFFFIQAIIWTVAISITSRDHSHAVVSGYDEQALRWDDVKQARAQSVQLGWSVDWMVESKSDLQGFRNIALRIRNRSGVAVPGAELTVKAFHRGNAAQPQLMRFSEATPGIYTSRIRVNRFGNWCFSGTAVAENQQYLIEDVVPVNENQD